MSTPSSLSGWPSLAFWWAGYRAARVATDPIPRATRDGKGPEARRHRIYRSGDRHGNQTWVVVVKASYLVAEDGSAKLVPEIEPVCVTPQYRGAVGESSLLRDGELVAEHPGTDITVLGTAQAPRGRPVSSLDVSVSVGPVAKALRVVGDRVWQRGRSSLQMTEPLPFVTMPITYERAFGGTSPLSLDPSSAEKDARNPIGTGFATLAEAAVGKALPNVEDPNHPIRGWDDRPRPAGLGPIPASWSPRLERAGTFDDEWSRKRMPLMPLDYDPRHTQSAHPDLVASEPFKGGELAVLKNLTPDSLWTIRIPRAYLVTSQKVVARR